MRVGLGRGLKPKKALVGCFLFLSQNAKRSLPEATSLELPRPHGIAACSIQNPLKAVLLVSLQILKTKKGFGGGVFFLFWLEMLPGGPGGDPPEDPPGDPQPRLRPGFEARLDSGGPVPQAQNEKET